MSSFTLEQWLFLGKIDPSFGLQLRLQAADSTDQLRECLEEGLAFVIDEIVQYRQFKQGMSEDQLTTDIVIGLSNRGIPAKHGTEYGGRTDISVNMKFGFLWIGEAKLWRGSGWAFKGLRQLLTRYSTGTPGREHGGIILYFDNHEAAPMMTKWRDNLEKRTLITTKVEHLNTVSFRTEHHHPSVGVPYTIRHYAVPLLWRPDDD